MKWLHFLLNRKLIVCLAVALILFVGGYGLTKLDLELMPKVTLDGGVSTLYAGSTSTLELEGVAENLERRVSLLDHVETYTSTTSEGMIEFQVMFEEGKGGIAFPNFEQTVQQLQVEYPQIEDHMTYEWSLGGTDSYFLDLYGEDIDALSQKALQVIKPRFEALPEAGVVTVMGVTEREVTIYWDEQTLRENGTDPIAISQRIQEENVNEVLGSVELNGEQAQIRWQQGFTKEDDIKTLTVMTNDGQKELQDLVTFSFAREGDRVPTAWRNGDADYISIFISPSSQETDVSLAAAAREELKSIQDENILGDAILKEQVAVGDFITRSIEDVSTNVLIGGLLSILIMLLFLKNIKATAIISLSIPTSILLTFALMWYLDYSINMVTLIGLGLGIGIMIDASIVILESIVRNLQDGLPLRNAVVRGTKEVSSAVIACVLTTIVVFIPIGMISGDLGQIFVVLGAVIVISLVSSVLISFTLIPVLADRWLTKPLRKKTEEPRLIRGYGSVIEWVSKKVWRSIAVIGLFFAIFAGSLFLLTAIPTGLMPDVYDRQAEVVVMLEPGVSRDERENVADAIHEKLQTVEDVDHYMVLLFGSNTLYSFINMTPESEATMTQSEVNETILDRLEELQDSYPVVQVGSAMDAGGVSEDISLTVKGDSIETLINVAEEVIEELEAYPALRNIRHSMESNQQVLQVELNESEIEGAAIVPSNIRQSISMLFARQPVGLMKDGSDDVAIYLEREEKIETLEQLRQVEWLTPEGMKPISDFVQFEEVTAPLQITRVDGDRVLSVSAEFLGEDLGSIRTFMEEVIASVDVPAGYELELSGQLEQQGEAFTELFIVLVLAIFLVFLVMAIQFNSLLQPIIVMSVIPLTFTGVLLGLFLLQKELNMLSGIGMVILIGVILNNAILLITRINQLREVGVTSEAALIQAGKDRLRPIFMTTFTTAAGMLPLALATGGASTYQSPLAIVIISGLLFGTGITLILIPAIYSVVDKSIVRIKGLKRRGSKMDEKEQATV